jgi:FlaA1/EpsC-like NDP-sugar epimerase
VARSFLKARSTWTIRRSIAVGAHLLLWFGGYWLALLLRFEGDIPSDWALNAWRALPVLLVARVFTFYRAGLFHGILRYSGVPEIRSVVVATTFGTLIFGVSALAIHRLGLPRSIFVLEWGLAIGSAGGLRFAARAAMHSSPFRRPADDAIPIALLGAGNAGELILRDLLRSPKAPFRVVCVLDDDPTKHGLTIHGVTIVGPVDMETLKLVASQWQVDRAILAMPTASGLRTREILEHCRDCGITLKTVPSLQQLADGDVQISRLRDVAIEDLLRREPVALDSTQISSFLTGRRVLVTGAAGSIGSELVRQIARFSPREIGLLDHSENGLFFLERELKKAFPDECFRAIVGDIKDAQRIGQIFEAMRPDVVYHAAAHKHVPLMEANPSEALRNNVFGTKVVADAAVEHGCEAFVLISTDKAVRPSSVMGASKRVAEMYVQSLNGRSSTRFVAVRFGNVLGSAGSVVPIFRAQIEAGGPVTVTHPDMRRYFMTIPEAAQLVLQASALGRGGEIFILDMGDLVKVVDLASDMIVLSGLRVGEDISIQFTGARPGEKLYEELMLDDEAAAETQHPKIRVARIAPRTHEQTTTLLERLGASLRAHDGDTVVAALADAVPEAALRAKIPDLIDAVDKKHDGEVGTHLLRPEIS